MHITVKNLVNLEKNIQSKINNLNYNEIDISTKEGLRDEMTKRANGRRTIPQIFFDDYHVGGYQELRELEKTGKLLSSLE